MQNQSKTPSPVQAGTPLLYSVTAACEVMGGMGRTWLYSQIKEGNLRTVKLGARTMIPATEITRFIDNALQVAA